MSNVPTEGGDVLVYLNGSKVSFRCDNSDEMLRGSCGCNVFRQKRGDATRLVCNACGAVYLTAHEDSK